MTSQKCFVLQSVKIHSRITQIKGTDLKICQYLHLLMEMCRRFQIKKNLLRFEVCAREIWEKFLYQHPETIE